MYYDRAMIEPDSKRFEQDMLGHCASNYWLKEENKAKTRLKTWKDKDTQSTKDAAVGKRLWLEDIRRETYSRLQCT